MGSQEDDEYWNAQYDCDCSLCQTEEICEFCLLSEEDCECEEDNED